MIFVTVVISSFFASLLTLFSGFGLGTLLMPVFALFFPLPLAIGMTAVVHLANNLFKLFLLGKFADKEIVMRFGLPAIASAYLGAWCLNGFSILKPIFYYTIGTKTAEITYLNLVLAGLMVLFALVEMLPFFKGLAFDKKYLGLGGVLSGFFGGLSGHQGALRSAFLIRCNLTKETFIGTGVVIACLIDFTRLFAYGSRYNNFRAEHLPLLITAILAAFLGAWLGNRYLKKTTLNNIQLLVAIMLLVIASLLALGLI
ncbi:MAG: sulfite exporter TauE/SafE family protein [Candidatus Omnitrophica bacterium]|nr:sulfite exporter TauE/SafE family protein [Candidatus Omnitrophota bacterium]